MKFGDYFANSDFIVLLTIKSNAILYLLKEGCQWHSLPHDLPRWSTVRTYFDRWKRKKVWNKPNQILLERLRIEEGRNSKPNAASIDSQSIKTTENRGRYTDLTEASKSKVCNAPRPQALEFNSREPGGRKRHILVDIFIISLMVSSGFAGAVL